MTFEWREKLNINRKTNEHLKTYTKHRKLSFKSSVLLGISEGTLINQYFKQHMNKDALVSFAVREVAKNNF